MKMEIERKEFRFKQLENEVKTRLKSEPYTANTPILPPQTSTADAEELDYLQEEVEKLRNNYRELDRENLKLKKKLEKTQAL
jgi:predicted transcriptional regulator